MLEVLFRLFVAGGLMVGSAQLPPLFAEPASGALSHDVDEGRPQPSRGMEAMTGVA